MKSSADSFFDEVVFPRLQSALVSGQSFGLWSFGPLGRGKTTTMWGSPDNGDALIPRALGSVFEVLEQKVGPLKPKRSNSFAEGPKKWSQGGGAPSRESVMVTVSFLRIATVSEVRVRSPDSFPCWFRGTDKFILVRLWLQTWLRMF